MARVVVVGGGISGLSIGYELLQRGIAREDLIVLESSDRPGGNLATLRDGEFAVEKGPNGFLDNSPPTIDLAHRLGIDGRLLSSDESAAVRFIFSRSKLRRVPAGPFGMLTSGLLPIGGTLRVFAEPFVKAGGHPTETVYDFAARRIGSHAAATLVDAMVSGVFAGDSKNLELRAAFPKMASFEDDYGSLTKALIAKKKERKREGKESGGPSGPQGKLTSFKNGFEELPAELGVRLGSSLRTDSEVVKVEKGSGSPFMVYPTSGKSIFADAVVLACPAWRAAVMVDGLDGELARLLGGIPTSPIIVVSTTYDEADLESNPHGFGFLVPRNQGPRILGCLWTSSIWTGRAPDGKVLLRTMVGGAQDPGAIDMTDRELLDLVASDLQLTMGLKSSPTNSWIFRYERGIAQYIPGHTDRLEQIEKVLLGHRGLFVGGSSYGGISVNHCIAEAPGLAERVMESVS